MARIAAKCEAYYLGTRGFTWCVSMNKAPSLLEAMVNAPDLGFSFEWQVLWIQLKRNTTNNVVASAGPTDWMNLGIVGNQVFSTAWYSYCRYTASNYWTVAKVRFGRVGGTRSTPWATQLSGVRRLGLGADC